MNNADSENLYRSTEEDVQFAIGQVALPGRGPAPILQVYWNDWTREKLEVVREAVRGGSILTNGKRTDGTCDLSIGPREQVACPPRICYSESGFGSTSHPFRRGLGWPTA